MCVKVLGDDKSLWEDEIYKFAKNHQLRVSKNNCGHMTRQKNVYEPLKGGKKDRMVWRKGGRNGGKMRGRER